MAHTIVVPGLVDMHVHFREPGGEHKEDIKSGSRAAARGGYTAVCCMPNTIPVTDSKETVKFVANKGKESGLVNLHIAGALSKGQKGQALADYEVLLKAGVCMLSDDGKTLWNGELMRRAAQCAKALGLMISDHAESPSGSEAEIVARDIALAGEIGCRMHLQHISTKASLALIREAKRAGISVTCETAPHYFTLTKDALLKSGANAKMNPPLGSESDRQAVIEAIQDGTVDVIATDHAPHSAEEKARQLDKAPFGIVGLETAFAVSYTTLVRPGHITLQKLIQLMSINPAKLMNIKCGGYTVFEIGTPYIIDSGKFLSKSRNTPFNGMEVYGRTVLTVCNGKTTWEEGWE